MTVVKGNEHRRLWIAVATGGYSGYFPLAPGTAGSVVGAGLVWVFQSWTISFQVGIIAGLTILGARACQQANRIFKKADSPRIVIDEIVGMMISMIGIPVTGYWLVVGFILFRIFDIVKPPPARYIDTHVKTGWGVMGDDIAAGIYSNILLHLMLRATI